LKNPIDTTIGHRRRKRINEKAHFHLTPYRPALALSAVTVLIGVLCELGLRIFGKIVNTGILTGDIGRVINLGILMLLFAVVAIICSLAKVILPQEYPPA
jgi:hypothetical protein